MKKHFILAAMAVAAIFAGCSNENEENLMPNEGAPVNFVIDGPVTRTTTDADGLTSFVESDKIAIYSSGLQNNMEGAVFTVGGEGVLTPDNNTSYSFNGMNGANFYAYYPIAAAGSATSAVFTVATDQSVANALDTSDFMTATNNVGAATPNPISLSFKHRLTLVKVALSGITASKVEINNVKPTATWTYSGDAVATSGEATTIIMGLKGSEYWAVIPAQTVNTGTVLFTITADGKTYTYTPISDITFTEGKAKKFTLALDPGKQTMVALNTDMNVQWETDGGESGTLTEIPLIAPVTASTPITSITDRTKLKAGEWGSLFNVSGFKATATAKEGGFDINVTEAGSGSWFNRTLFYRGAKDFDLTKTYTLKFKASSTTTGQLWISVTDKDDAAQDKKDKFYHLNAPGLKSNNNGAKILADTQSSPTDFTIKITPNSTTTTSTTASDSDFSTTSFTNYYIGIGINSTNINTYSITDIVLTQD